jgi:peptidoglycan/LPS O-acetylase OafA/YrhL
MDMKTLRRLAAVAMAGTAAIHLVLSPEYFEEQPYIGVLFVLGAVAGGVVAYRLWRAHDVPSWLLGTLIAAGMGAGFVLSRTVGLPGFHEAEWEPSGLLSLAFEGAFVAVALRALPRGLASRREPVT